MLIIFDKFSNLLECNGLIKKLGARDALVLDGLLIKEGELATRDFLIKHAWGDRVVTDISLPKSISNLRAMINEIAQVEDAIITVPRLGYKADSSLFLMRENNGAGVEEVEVCEATNSYDMDSKKSGREYFSLTFSCVLFLLGGMNLFPMSFFVGENYKSPKIYKQDLSKSKVIYSDEMWVDQSLINKIDCSCKIFIFEDSLSIYFNGRSINLTLDNPHLSVIDVDRVNSLIASK